MARFGTKENPPSSPYWKQRRGGKERGEKRKGKRNGGKEGDEPVMERNGAKIAVPTAWDRQRVQARVPTESGLKEIYYFISFIIIMNTTGRPFCQEIKRLK